MDQKGFGSFIQRLMEKKDLDMETSYQMFKDVLLNGQPELQQGAFLAALAAKGETVEELYGAWKAIYELDTNKVSVPFPRPLLENSGTGMDGLFTFNVSTAAAIVAASLGVVIARHGARALTSRCGTVDILESLGLNVEADVDLVAKSIKEVGIGLFNGMSPRVHPGALARILTQIHFGSTLNISASLASPVMPSLALRGVFSEGVMKKIAELMRLIGYTRAMVVYGLVGEDKRGMDEISPCGPTRVIEFSPSGMESYEVYPMDLGSKTYGLPEILHTGDMESETRKFLSVIAGRGPSSCMDFTALNAGAILYVYGKAASLREGREEALKAMASGAALKKLMEWIKIQDRPDGSGYARVLGMLEKLKLL